MKNIKRNTIMITIIIITAMIGWNIYQTQNASQKVTTQNITRKNFEVVVSASGKVASSASAELSFTSNGRISAILVKEGDKVKKDQILAYLDGTTLKKQEEKAWADYKFQLEKIREFEEKNKDKPKDAMYQITKAQLEATRDSYAALVAQTISAYNEKTLISPINGTVAKINKKVGEIPTNEPVITIIDDTQLEFIAEVDEYDIGTLTQRLQALITLDAYPGNKFQGVITKIQKIPQFGETRSTFYPVHISLPQEQAKFLIGMKGDADIQIATKENIITIPLEMIQEEKDQLFIYTVKENKVKKVNIQIGLQNETEAEVLNGLKEGDEIIVEPLNNLSDGTPVQKKKAKKQ